MNTPSEFQILPDGSLLMILEGDIFLSRKFSNTNEFTKDIRLTNTDEYEYSPLVRDDFIVYRRGGNYFLRNIDSAYKYELQLTKDESDTISYQILDVLVTHSSVEKGRELRFLFARYNSSRKEVFLFPDFSRENVTVDRQRRGISEVMILDYTVNVLGDSIRMAVDTVKFTDTTRYSVQFGLYAEKGKKIIFDVETLDRHERKLFSCIPFRKETRLGAEAVLYSESDPAWFERHGNPTLVLDSIIIFESEISGFSSIYRLGISGLGLRKIVGGDYTILSSVYDSQNQKIYFVANMDSPAEWRIYETDFEGRYVKTLTDSAGGCEELTISPDGGVLAFLRSTVSKPNELFIHRFSSGTTTQITSTISPKFTDINWTLPELIAFNNDEDGTRIYAYLYKPPSSSFRQRRQTAFPLICFAHGGGYWQNVSAGFAPYSDNFMVNTFLTSQGFIVLDVDFRGSMGYGKNFRTKTYKNLGYWEVSDFISGINYLDRLGLIDRQRVGIYGGSYGGFVSLMAAFRHPEYFKAAAALRPVSDWKNYLKANWWFTLARLGEYEDNPLAYEISSPITYAAQLSIPLLITHGMRDDNVFFQQSVLLTQKLIEEKKDFEIMYYPKEYHSFRLQSSWLDQYKRIFNFFKKHL